jgi:hypothetical protein
VRTCCRRGALGSRFEFLGATHDLPGAPEDLGEPGTIAWYPDRTWHGRTYVPATSVTSGGYELFGYVRFVPAAPGGEPTEFFAEADFTDETAERNPDWTLDVCDEVVGSWRGEAGAVAEMTLVWGRPLVSGGTIATAELADLAVDQCEVVNERFTLLAPDDYRQDLLEIKLFDAAGRELARESLYTDDDDEEDPAAEESPAAEQGGPAAEEAGPAAEEKGEAEGNTPG